MDPGSTTSPPTSAAGKTTAWKAALVVILVILALLAVLRVLLSVRRRALDSVPPSPALSMHSAAHSPAPPSYTTQTHARRRNPASRCFRSVSSFFRPFSSSYVHDEARWPADAATLEARRRHNLAIQQALIDAGLMLPPIRSGPRHNTAVSGDVPSTTVPARPPSAGAAAKEGRAARFWRWLSASGNETQLAEGQHVLGLELHQSPTQVHSTSFAMQTLQREQERAARRARRERRREQEVALREEEGIALGLPAYTKEKGENEESLMGEGLDADSDSDDGGLEVVACPATVARRAERVAQPWEVEQRV